MYTVYAIAAIGAIWGASVAYSECYDFAEGVLGFILGGVISAIMGAIVVAGISSVQPTSIEERVEKNEVPIYELSRGLGVGGSFYLGYGSVDSVVAYRYSVRLPNGNFKDEVVTEGQVALERHPVSGIKDPHYTSVKVFERSGLKHPSKWLFNPSVEMLKSETWVFYYPPGTEYPFK